MTKFYITPKGKSLLKGARGQDSYLFLPGQKEGDLLDQANTLRTLTWDGDSFEYSPKEACDGDAYFPPLTIDRLELEGFIRRDCASECASYMVENQGKEYLEGRRRRGIEPPPEDSNV